MTDQQPYPAIDRWRALDIQVVAFTLEPQFGRDQEWFHELTGIDCNSNLKRFERVDDGAVEGRQLSLHIDPIRIIWRISPLMTAEIVPEDKMPTAGRMPDAMQFVDSLMEKWLDGSCPPINRFAFVANILLPTASRDESYRRLATFLPCVKVDPASHDLLFRVNRPRMSKTPIDNLSINRLMTWASVRFEAQTHVMSEGAHSVAPVVISATDGCALTADINTSKDFVQPLPANHLFGLYRELAAMAAEIAERGDAP